MIVSFSFRTVAGGKWAGVAFVNLTPAASSGPRNSLRFSGGVGYKANIAYTTASYS